MSEKKYADYFKIDPNYYPSVTLELIQSEQVSWKNFYPHETFINLLEKVHETISRLTPRSIWLEGAYGSGKSHAALTVKSLFEAQDEEVEHYFRKYNLSSDLCQKFLTDKNSGKIIVVHKIGSSSVHSDQDLILAIYNSVLNSLKIHGAENHGENSLKDSALKWLEKKANHDYLGQLITEEKYIWDLGGKKIDEIISILKDGSPELCAKIMSCLVKAAGDNGVMAFKMDIQDLANWIKNVIEANNLKAILFIWDEFTEFFQNNATSLTGFQTLAELSFSVPFYFLIVSHATGSLFFNVSSAKKILDRFTPPVKIDMPDNMAFKLMAQAMQITDDPELKSQWENYRKEINHELENVRTKICSTLEHFNSNTFLLDNDLQAVIPIHPYAAFMLKHLSVVFGSNQRSMFSFIINDESELHAFKWYINNYGPTSQPYTLTADLLWDFFSKRDKNPFNESGHLILNEYNALKPNALSQDEQRVLKTILLLQAFTSKNSEIDLLRPNDDNINLAFNGTNWPENRGAAIAAKLVKKGLLFRRILSDGSFEYTIANTMDNANSINQEKEELLKIMNTQTLIERANLLEAVFIPEELSDRFTMKSASVHDLQKKINDVSRQSTLEQFSAIVIFALNENEAAQLRESLPRLAEANEIIFIDASLNQMGLNDFERYIEDSAYSKFYFQKGDSQRAGEFQAKAREYLSNWKVRISNGVFVLYTKKAPHGKRLQDSNALARELKDIDFQVYSCGLEHYTVTASLFSSKPQSRQFKLGARCGITQKLSGQFLAPREDNSLSHALAGAWEVANYWEDEAKQNLPVVRAKILVEKIIAENLAMPSRSVSILEIYNALKNPPFGFMPNNFTAFMLGFLLKEYSGKNFFWSNGLKTEILNTDNLADTIFNVLNFDINHPRNFREEFITIMSREQKAFLDCMASAFNIPPEECVSIDNVKEKISASLRKLRMPLWFVNNILPELNTKSDAQALEKAIDALNRLSRDDDAVIQIGSLALSSRFLAEDLALTLTEANCRTGLLSYIEKFHDGVLPNLAAKIQDDGAYVTKFINAAHNFSSPEKLDEKINALILEYEIVEESNKSLPKSHSLSETVALWISRINNLKISFEAARSYASGFMPLLEILYEITRFNNLAPQTQGKFLNALRLYRSDFDEFAGDQLKAFKIIAAPLIDGLTEQEITEIFNALPEKQFMKSASEYFRLIEAQVKNYKTGLLKAKLRETWQNFTGTENPEDWSARFDTPILCMIDEQKRAIAKQVFDVLMKKSPTEAEANFAIEFMSSANFYDALNDPKTRDKLFAENFLKDYRFVLPDVNFVREKLRSSTREQPFFWMDNPAIQKLVKTLAEKEYELHFRDEVLALIDRLEPILIRPYVRDLLAKNMNVGIEILKQQNEKETAL